MQNKKKVLFYLWSFSLGGGAEKILATIVNNLDPDKYDIDILVVGSDWRGKFDILISLCQNLEKASIS